MSKKRGAQHRRKPSVRNPAKAAHATETLKESVYVCRVCGSTLNSKRSLDEDELRSMFSGEGITGNILGFSHPEAFAPVDGHAPEPMLDQRDLTKDGCDFCCHEPSTAAYVLPGQLTVFYAPGVAQAFGRVWTACGRCQPLVDRGRMGDLLDRVMHFAPTSGMSNEEKQQMRGMFKQIYEQWFAAGPQGPFAIS